MTKKSFNFMLFLTLCFVALFSFNMKDVVARGKVTVPYTNAPTTNVYSPFSSTSTTSTDDEDDEDDECDSDDEDCLKKDYSSSKGKRVAKKCAARYCEGFGNPYGKCFDTSAAYSLLSSSCEEELEETGHGTRALYDFLNDMNKTFLSACGNINSSFTDEELFAGAKDKETSHRVKYLYKKSRVNTSEAELSVVDWDIEVAETVNPDESVVVSDCIDLNTDTETPSYVYQDKYCIDVRGVAVKPEIKDGAVKCPVSHPTMQNYSKPKEIDSCERKMFAYGSDGYYKYERLTSYRDASGKCPVYIGYGPLQKGATTPEGVNVSKGKYYPLKFFLGQNSRMLCSRENFNLSEDKMTYKVKMKHDGAAMSQLINGSIDVLIGGVSAATAGVKASEVKEKAFMEGEMCDKVARPKTAESCAKNNGLCIAKDGSEMTNCGGRKIKTADKTQYEKLLKNAKGDFERVKMFLDRGFVDNDEFGNDLWADAEIRFDQCLVKKSGISFRKTAKVGDTKKKGYAKAKKGYVYNESECSSAGGKWVAFEDSYRGQLMAKRKDLKDAQVSLTGDAATACEAHLTAYRTADSNWLNAKAGDDEKAKYELFLTAEEKYYSCLERHSGSAGRLGMNMKTYQTYESEVWDRQNPVDMDDENGAIDLSHCNSANNKDENCIEKSLAIAAFSIKTGRQVIWTRDGGNEYNDMGAFLMNLCRDYVKQSVYDNGKIKSDFNPAEDGKSVMADYKACMNDGDAEMQKDMKKLQRRLVLYQQKYKADMAEYNAAKQGLINLEKDKKSYSSNISDARDTRKSGLNNVMQGGLQITQAVMQNSQNKELIEGKCVITNQNASAVEGVIANEGERIKLEYDMF